jgi:hypothetical protein
VTHPLDEKALRDAIDVNLTPERYNPPATLSREECWAIYAARREDPAVARREALRRIEDAALNGYPGISFLHLDALEDIPSEVAHLTAVKAVGFNDVSGNTLSRWNLRDISALGTMPALEFVSLPDQATPLDVSWLAKARSLRMIHSGFFADGSLEPGRWRDLSPLANLDALEVLDFGQNGRVIDDLRPLANLPKLRRLRAVGLAATDFDPLGTLAALEWLQLIQTYQGRQTSVVDMSPLGSAINLARLEIYGGSAQRWDFLSALKNLERLDLTRSNLSDFAPLARLSKLRRLYSTGCDVADLTPLSGLAALDWLAIEHSQSMPLAPLLAIPNLNYALVQTSHEVGPRETRVVSLEAVRRAQPALPQPVTLDHAQAAPDLPLSFGFNVQWLALRTEDTAAVAHALQLVRTRPANWSTGLSRACAGIDHGEVFVTPPVDGWTLVVYHIWAGLISSMPHEVYGDAAVDNSQFLDLSAKFGEAQHFYYEEAGACDFSYFARARDGSLERFFSFGGETSLAHNHGNQSPEEADLGFLDLSGLERDAALEKVRAHYQPDPGRTRGLGVGRRHDEVLDLQLRHPRRVFLTEKVPSDAGFDPCQAIPSRQNSWYDLTGEDMHALAAKWSVDPTRLHERFGPLGVGLIGKLPNS